MNIFGKIYLCLFIALIATELIAARTSFTRLDTMSEYVWAWQSAQPILARVIIGLGLIVLYVHLCVIPGKIK